MSGLNAEHQIHIPQIKLAPSGTSLPFTLLENPGSITLYILNDIQHEGSRPEIGHSYYLPTSACVLPWPTVRSILSSKGCYHRSSAGFCYYNLDNNLLVRPCVTLLSTHRLDTWPDSTHYCNLKNHMATILVLCEAKYIFRAVIFTIAMSFP